MSPCHRKAENSFSSWSKDIKEKNLHIHQKLSKLWNTFIVRYHAAITNNVAFSELSKSERTNICSDTREPSCKVQNRYIGSKVNTYILTDELYYRDQHTKKGRYIDV